MKSRMEAWSRLAAVAVSCCFVLTSVGTTNAQELRQVFDPPLWGTYYLLSVQAQENPSPPYPYDPYGGTLPVYEMPGFAGTYLVADSPQDFAALVAANSADGEMETMDEGEPPPPPGGGGGEWEGPPPPPVYGTNDLVLSITISNAVANFIILTPDPDTAFDLFGTTNLDANAEDLSSMNWLWIDRTEVGQTNIPVTDLWAQKGFFILGTMLDGDADGLTDAYEKLTTHTDPQTPDMDADGLSDLYELFVMHTSPFVPEAAPTLDSRPVERCPVP